MKNLIGKTMCRLYADKVARGLGAIIKARIVLQNEFLKACLAHLYILS